MMNECHSSLCNAAWGSARILQGLRASLAEGHATGNLTSYVCVCVCVRACVSCCCADRPSPSVCANAQFYIVHHLQRHHFPSLIVFALCVHMCCVCMCVCVFASAWLKRKGKGSVWASMHARVHVWLRSCVKAYMCTCACACLFMH